jgi:diaminopimelate epimerase
MELRFTKMNGAGNDFVLLDNRTGEIKLKPEQIRLLCDRHRGVGADGVLLVEPAEGRADFRMRYYNADGGEAEMCGNGARCFARFASRVTGPFDRLRFETVAGLIYAELRDAIVTVNLSRPTDLRLNQKLEVAGERLLLHSVNTGVPHAVVFVSELKDTDVVGLGSAIRHHAAFQPKGTNANFVQELEPGSIAIRTYERGVEGETLACGTGISAAALVYSELTDRNGPVRVRAHGGDQLEVSFRRLKPGFEDVELTGPAEFSFEGTINLP